MRLYIGVFLVCILMSCVSKSPQETVEVVINQDSLRHIQAYQAFIKKQTSWVDSVFDTLTTDEQLGQLFMVAAYTESNEAHFKQLDKLIKDYHIGGLMFSKGSPIKEATLTNRFQAKAKTPLLVSIDGEWGLSMRLDSTMIFPYQMTLGAMNKPNLVYQMGREIGRQCKRMGIHVNFAPVADINSNPKNPVIGVRSFGEDKEKVTQNAIAYMKGLQHEGILAVGKHFPGHGDTDKDSHFTLPLLKHDANRLDSLELYPFKRLIADSLQAMMVAHLHVPAIDKTPNRPTSLSNAAVQVLLKDSLGFGGLVFTDAMGMKGVTKFFKAGEADLAALKAGNDVLLLSEDVPKAFSVIKNALKQDSILQKAVNQKVRKILAAKYFAGLNDYKPIKIDSLYQDLHTEVATRLNLKLHEQAVTFVKNDKQLLPFAMEEDSLSFASLVIGKGKNNVFQKKLSEHTHFEHFSTSKHTSQAQFDKLFHRLKQKDIVVIGLFGVNQRQISKTFGITAASKQFIKKLSQKTRVVLVVFGNAYSLSSFENLPYLVAAYTERWIMQKVVPSVLFGKVKNQATLPVSPSEKLHIAKDR